MKKYTQEEYDAIERDERGYKNCPTGDYTQVVIFGARTRFGARSSFGEWSSFGDGSSFGEGCKIEGDYEFTDFLKFEGFGSEKRCTYFWLLSDKTVYVRCGCFAGTLEEWIEKVKETHGENKFGQGYLKIADLVKWQWGIEDEDK